MPRLFIGTLPLDPVDPAEALARVEGIVNGSRAGQIVTLNALMYNASLHDEALREAVRSAALVVPDSAGIALACRLLHDRRPRRVTGIDLLRSICALAAQQGHGIYLLGGREGAAREAAAALQRQYPGLRVTGCHHGYFGSGEEEGVVREINASGAAVLFAALAMPEQEKWIARNLPGLGVKAAMGVGGSFDVIAGRLRRAPGWMQEAGLEWLYRLLQQPWRWRRILELPVFVVNIAKLP